MSRIRGDAGTEMEKILLECQKYIEGPPEHLVGGVQGARLVVCGHHHVDPILAQVLRDVVHHEVHHPVVHPPGLLIALVHRVLIALITIFPNIDQNYRALT